MTQPTIDTTYPTFNAAPGAATYAAPEGYRDGWLDEVKLDLYTRPGSSGGLMRPFAGQSIWLAPYGLTLEDEEAITVYLSTDEAATPKAEIEERFKAVLFMLSKVVVTWNVTDGRGRPYPPPQGEGDTDAFKRLPAKLVAHILTLIKGESEGKDSAASAS